MDKRYKHGDCCGEKSRLYHVWDNMITRCYRKSYAGYHNYGARGITVCDEWRHDFTAFRDWALKNGYREDLQIDRCDVDGNYCPENCRFVTASRQARNRRNTVYIEFGGVRATLIDFCELFLVPYKIAHRRLKEGWPIVKVLSSVPLPSPKQPKGRTA